MTIDFRARRRRIPVRVMLEGVSGYWRAAVVEFAHEGEWCEITPGRLIWAESKYGLAAVRQAVAQWRASGAHRESRTCERCGHEWVSYKPTSVRCPKCLNRYRYSRTHHLGLEQMIAKGLDSPENMREGL